MPTVIDGRPLEPPQPFERVMEALDHLAPGDEIVLILNCRPQPLYRVLQRNGLAWNEAAGPDGSLEIHIYHPAAPPPLTRSEAQVADAPDSVPPRPPIRPD